MRDGRGKMKQFEERLEQMGHERLANPSERKTCKRDPDLRSGKEGIDMIADVLCGQCPWILFGQQIVDLGRAKLHRGVFSRDKETVQKYKDQYEEALGQCGHALARAVRDGV